MLRVDIAGLLFAKLLLLESAPTTDERMEREAQTIEQREQR
jgi:hypothetical protein